MDKAKPFYLRLTPSSRELLDKASEDQNKSRAKVIDDCIQGQLKERYSDVETRLGKMLGQQ